MLINKNEQKKKKFSLIGVRYIKYKQGTIGFLSSEHKFLPPKIAFKRQYTVCMRM